MISSSGMQTSQAISSALQTATHSAIQHSGLLSFSSSSVGQHNNSLNNSESSGSLPKVGGACESMKGLNF